MPPKRKERFVSKTLDDKYIVDITSSNNESLEKQKKFQIKQQVD